ncbi:MAG: bifunctional methylenetetrahydrofolate dehydrogenase/methenyltetrahydrofolate cyclohydrolase FolD [Oligoflexales bacterium]
MLLDGKALALKIRSQLADKVQTLQAQKQTLPGLAVILIGDDPASKVYVHHKEKACQSCGIHSETHRYSATTNVKEVENLIDNLNQRNDIHGILLQLPLPTGWQSWPLIQRISPTKDVDGLHAHNQGMLCWNQTALQPCTPKGVVTLLKANGITLQGKHALVVGRSALVGRPLATMLTHENATVTLAHSHTKNLAQLCQTMDIVVAAAGQAQFMKKEWFQKDAVVVDVGIHRIGEKLCGDVDPAVAEIASAHTPVPGGVGPMTIATLLSNCVQAWESQ